MSFIKNLDNILEQHKKIQEDLNEQNIEREEFVKLSKKYSELEKIVWIIKKYKKAISDLESAKSLLLDKSIDQETKDMANEEIAFLGSQMNEIENEIKIALIPKDKADSKNAILEIRGGTGGEEATLFAADLFNMYKRYAQNNKWQFEILSISDNGIGGYKEASAIIKGENVFAKMKFESGVHRIQRIPKTETNGRIHTSAATVAMLPEAEEIDVNIKEEDLRIDTYRAQGAGGQHVNTTDSAVRITHIPTGVVVCQQDESSQHKNKAKALKILRSRIYQQEIEKQQEERAGARKSQVGSGDRSERIRTYNQPEGRVTDHRINLTLYKFDEILTGDLSTIIDSLIADDQSKKLANIEN